MIQIQIYSLPQTVLQPVVRFDNLLHGLHPPPLPTYPNIDGRCSVEYGGICRELNIEDIYYSVTGEILAARIPTLIHMEKTVHGTLLI